MAKGTALVTGANGGIGRETVELLAAKGYRVFGTVRSLAKGKELADAAKANGWDVTLPEMDVRSEDSVREAFAKAGEIDILVNNAGFEVWGPLNEMTAADLIDQFDTNVYGPFRCITAVLDGMRKRGSGVIVNVSSVAGRVAAPLNGAYAASKFALEALSESLHFECGHFGVRVHIIEPGLIDTGFGAARRLVGAATGDESSPYFELIGQWERATQALAGERGRTPPKAVAEAILEAIEVGDKVRYPVGPDANMVLLARKNMDDATFESTMRQQLGLTW